jgi:ubiquinone/menaquinone biosynthesis C-methylase UbiE
MVNDKKKIICTLKNDTFRSIELGCGGYKRNKEAIGIDLLDTPDVDIQGDVYEVLSLFPDQCVDAVFAYHFIEHVPDVSKLLIELARVIKPNGVVEFVAPHFSNPYFYSDPTHRSFFGLYTFCYYTSGSSFVRKVPMYDYKPQFKLTKVDLHFKSTRQFYVRYGLKKLIGLLFNSCNYLKELYEENFCYLIPCYEVRYILHRY